MEGIRQKFRDSRRSMVHLPEVVEMKKKYGTKNPRPPIIETELTPAKRRPVAVSSEVCVLCK